MSNLAPPLASHTSLLSAVLGLAAAARLIVLLNLGTFGIIARLLALLRGRQTERDREEVDVAA